MFQLSVENQKGETLRLTQTSNYIITSIDGLTPPPAVINNSTVATNDGAIYNSARVETRTLILSIAPRIPVEANRNTLYRYFNIKKPVRVYYQNNSKRVYIDGYVESMEGSLFDMTQTIVVTILCLDPFWKSQQEETVDFSSTIDLFEFPFETPTEGIEFSRIDKTKTVNVNNQGDVETGMVIELIANGTVQNPRIYNADTRDVFALDVSMQQGDVIRVNTNRGHKQLTLTREGETQNIINSITKESVWPILEPGDNVFTYECDAGEDLMELRFLYTNNYGGV